MATSKPRFPITIEPETYEIIEKYRHENRIKSTSKATVQLLLRGIDEFYRREQDQEEQRNKAPTAEDAAEALYELLYYHLGQPPTVDQVNAFNQMLPILCKGLADV